MINDLDALPFLSSEDEPVPGEAKEAPSEAAATRRAVKSRASLNIAAR